MKRLFFILAILACFHVHAELFFTPQMISSHLKGYSDDEVRLIKKDLFVVRSVCLEGAHDTNHRFYLATAGAPGARKTTILERFLSTHPEYQEGVYLDPDARTLKFMVHTYYALSLNHHVIATANNYDIVIKNGYEKWRGGSNYIALSLIEESFEAGRSVIHGTTSTGAHVPNFFAKLKENDYDIVLLLCSCSDDFRYEAVDYRNRNIRFYQSSPEDAFSKGTLFSQRMGAYFAYADILYFYWSDDLLSPERLAGVWTHGHLEVLDHKAMQHFINKYERDRATLANEGVALPSFHEFLQE